MTETPIVPFPASPYCRVRARVASIWADGPDDDTHPDWRPAVGERVVLTPSIGSQLLTYDVAGTDPIIVTVERVDCEVDADGWLVKSDGRPVYIAPTDDPLLSATGWTWTASIKGKSITFSAPTGGTVDLALFVATPAVDAVERLSVAQVAAEYFALHMAEVTSLRDQTAAIRDDVQEISGLTGEDAAVAVLAGDPESATSLAISASHERVVMLPTPSGADDTAAVQALLDTPGPKRVVGRKGATYRTLGWVIPSDTTLDMTDCTIERLTGGRMLIRNTAYKGAGARDRNIHIVGGDWHYRGDLPRDTTDSNNLHTIMLHRVDDVSVTGATIRDTPSTENSKYSLYFIDVTGYRAERIRFVDRPSDGVHISGPADNGRIQELSGYTGDDFVGVTGCDYAAYQATPGGGNITNLNIEDLTLEAASSGVLLLPGNNAGTMHTVSGVTIRGIRGSALNNVIRINDDANSPGAIGGYWDDILIEGVTASSGAGFGAPTFWTSTEGRALGATMRNITIRDSFSPTGTAQIVVQSGVAIDNLVIDGISTAAAATMGLVDIKAGSTIGSLSISHARAALAAGGYVLKQQGTVASLSIDDWVTTGTSTAGALLYGQTSDVQVSRCKSAGQFIMVNAATEAPVITAGQVVIGTAGFSVVYVAAGAATLLGASLSMKGSTAAINRSGAAVIRAHGGVRADAAKITPQAGDQIHNTNASAAMCPHVGLVTYDGSAWRAAIGHIATGVATLSDGSATVTTAFITANAQFSLELHAVGVDPGQPYISSRVPGVSFTISSTSPTDTSQIRWYLLRV